MKGHVHTYDIEGRMTCCSLEEKINKNSEWKAPSQESRTLDQEHDDHDHDHHYEGWKSYLPAIVSFTFLIIGLISEHFLNITFFKGSVKLIWYLLSYIPVAYPVIIEAWKALKKGEVFTEFFLMALATFGAFIIGEYPEGVAVMLFYAIGELFQTAAVRNTKNSITALLDVRPKSAVVFRNK